MDIEEALKRWDAVQEKIALLEQKVALFEQKIESKPSLELVSDIADKQGQIENRVDQLERAARTQSHYR